METLIGTVLEGRYEILDRLDSGGMGTVYRARQLTVGRDVAVKVVRSSKRESDAALRRFENEAQIIARLRHPNTLTLFDVGRTDDDLVFIVTELLRGEPLDAALESAPLGVDRTLSIVAQVADAISEAHDAGIIHRDLKPGNVFLERVGSREIVRVLDFGIAKLLQGVSLTGTGMVCGTAAYMAPEQATATVVDGRTDIYSLGVITFECLTGGLPFTADTAAGLMYQHVHEAPPSLRDAGQPPLPPAEVDALVKRMLAKDPAGRPASAAALFGEIAGLRRTLGGTPVGSEATVPSAGAADCTTAGDQSLDPMGATHATSPGSTGDLRSVLRPHAWPYAAAVLLLVGVVAVGWLSLWTPTGEGELPSGAGRTKTSASTPASDPIHSTAVDAGGASRPELRGDANAAVPAVRPERDKPRRRRGSAPRRLRAAAPPAGPEPASADAGHARANLPAPPAPAAPAEPPGAASGEKGVTITAPPGFVDVPFGAGE